MDETGRDPAENAYLVWCSEGEQLDTKTAELTGIPRSTIGHWRRTQDWRAKWLGDAGPEAEQAASVGRAMIRAGMPLVAKRLLAIIGGQIPVRNLQGEIVTDDAGRPIMQWEAEHRDAINAAKIFALYGLGQPSLQDTAGYGAIPDAQWKPSVSAGEPTDADLRAKASAMIEATVASVNTRTKTKGRRV